MTFVEDVIYATGSASATGGKATTAKQQTRRYNMDRYDEALEKARAEYEKAREQGYTWLMDLLEGMFPDLRESEDERMLRELMECFDVWGVTLEYKTEVMAWIRGLIEQKEPLTPEKKMNHPLYLEGFDVGKKVGEVVSKPADSACQSFRDALFDCIDETVVTYIDDYTPDSRGGLIEGQTERWAERLYAIANASQTDANASQTDANAEWSEEDERMLKQLDHILTIFDGDLVKKLQGEVNVISDSAYSSLKIAVARCRSFLELLPERFDIQPKREWSYEDEDTLAAIVNCIYDCKIRIGKADADKYATWLKSLRPQPHWKPSKEQMKVLQAVITGAIPDSDGAFDEQEITTLTLLFNDLKKLI